MALKIGEQIKNTKPLSLSKRGSIKRPCYRVTCEQSVFSRASWVVFNQKVDMFLERTGTEVLTSRVF